jgi:hypothetical protein
VCWAFGTNSVNGDHGRGRIQEIVNGLPGAVYAFPRLPTLNGVCMSATTCLAFANVPGGAGKIVQIDNGLPGPVRSVPFWVRSLSCPSASVCFVVAAYQPGGWDIDRDQRRHDHVAGDTHAGEQPPQSEPAGPGLVLTARPSGPPSFLTNWRTARSVVSIRATSGAPPLDGSVAAAIDSLCTSNATNWRTPAGWVRANVRHGLVLQKVVRGSGHSGLQHR